MQEWSKWRRFPDPRQGEFLIAPIGPGCYELRRLHSDGTPPTNVLFGAGKNLALRMTSLLPIPFGAGGRNNSAKRDYVWFNIASIEYRTIAFADRDDAFQFEKRIRGNKSYFFDT